jgi:hypothetical protein
MRVPQVVEAVRGVQPRRLERPAVAAQDRGLAQRLGAQGVREYERVVVGLARGLEQPLQLGADRVGHRHAARRAPRLRRAELADDVVLADANAPRQPVDVAPAQRDQLALA